ncbi:MAG: hypothetical protein WA890_16895 [Micromonospora sp.]
MGTIQDPNPDRDWLKRSYVDTSTNPYSIDARTEMMGRLAEGTGGSPATRAVMRAVAAITLVAIAVSVVLGVLDLL